MSTDYRNRLADPVIPLSALKTDENRSFIRQEHLEQDPQDRTLDNVPPETGGVYTKAVEIPGSCRHLR